MQTLVMTLVLMSATLATAQNACSSDADCESNKFCYRGGVCSDYINCTWYQRQEAALARIPSQCGPCLLGYSADKAPEDTSNTNAESDSCHADPTTESTAWENIVQIAAWVGGAAVISIVVLAVFFFVRALIRRKQRCKDTDPEQPPNGQSLALTDFTASAPPLDSIQENNNEYLHPEANSLLPYKSKGVEEYGGDVSVTNARTVRAQPFHSPDWVQTDPSYNPEDYQQVVAPSPLEIADDETMTSSWTPGESNAIPVNPFAGINAELEQNRVNTALARGTCPSPSTSEGRGSRQGNEAAGNAERFSGANSNPRGNANSIQIQIFNYVNQGSDGS